MILVELETGSQRLFGSLDEFSGAIRRGEVGPSSRIYHRTSGQWLPIDAHPEFRNNRFSGKETERPLPPLERMRWTFYSAESPQAEVEPPTEPAPEPVARSDHHEEPGWRRILGRAVRRFRSPTV
jgi:hypothetical protein